MCKIKRNHEAKERLFARQFNQYTKMKTKE